VNLEEFLEILHRHILYAWDRRKEANNRPEQEYWSKVIADLHIEEAYIKNNYRVR